MFTPPRCPYRDCSLHFHPRAGFFRRRGSYWPKCRPWPVPRFDCKGCGRSFSRQTFRADYHDHRPDLNAALFRLLASGLGLRQSARLLKVRARSVERKFRKIATQLHCLHRNLLRPLPGDLCFLLDEMETFEGSRRARPVTVPVLVLEGCSFVVDADAQPIRPSGKKSVRGRAEIRRSKRRLGARPSRSDQGVRRVMSTARKLWDRQGRVHGIFDRKPGYPARLREVFGTDRVSFEQHSGKRPRTPQNPLFPINHTHAMARDLVGRLRRRSWLASKQRRCLRLGLALFTCFRNYHRPRTNRVTKTPAQLLGLCRARLSFEAMLSWRQDFGRRSLRVAGVG
jgi:transposase-like protein